MTIIRKGVSKIGTAWSKKVDTVDVPADGAEALVYCMIIPPYVWPGQMWLNWDAIDISTSGNETDPWAHGEFNMFGRFVNIPASLRMADFDSDAEILQLVETYAPIDEDQILAIETDADLVGITGQTDAVMPPQMKQTLFFERQYQLNLASNAYPTNSNKIRYYINGNWRGDVRTDAMVDVTQPKLLCISAVSSAALSSEYPHYAATGALEIEDIYEKLVVNIPGHDTVPPYVTNDTLDANLQIWLQQGHSQVTQSLTNHAELMRTYVKSTLRLDIYQPSPAHTIHAA